MNDKEYINLELEFGAQNYSSLPVVAKSAKNCWITDINGKTYLDMMSAYSAINLGHCNEEILKTLYTQASNLCLTSRAYHNDQLPQFLHKICNITKFDKCLPMNTGAEAVETAIKAIRKWALVHKNIPNDKCSILVANNNFHGRTTTIVGFSSEPQYKYGFGPFSGGFIECEYGNIESFEKAITHNTAAIFIEPIQGEAGVIFPPKGFLKQLRALADKHNVLLVLDEVQTGFSRTGKLFAFEHENIRPDAIVVGKALGGGILPISAFLSNSNIMSVFTPGDHGSTFGGNPLACAVANTSLDLLSDSNLLNKVSHKGQYFLDALKDNLISCNLINNIRGLGLFAAIEIVPTDKAKKFVLNLLEEQIISKDTHDTVIRLAPPLTISYDELDFAIEKIIKVFK